MADAVESTERRTDKRPSGGGVVLGLLLMAIGAVYLAGNFGYEIEVDYWRLWPFVLIALGIARILFPGDDCDGRWGGYWLLLVGLWGWVSFYHLFGLDAGETWPIFLIGGGGMLIGRQITARARRSAGGDHVS